MSSSFVGKLIDEKYRVIDKIGEGGSATVYRAEELILSRIVAIKVMHPGDFSVRENRLRFEREACIVAELKHKNIVTVLRFAFLSDSEPYMVMEYVEGRSLAQELSNCKTLSPGRVVNIGLQICGAIDYAHKLGIIHRDLKPQNMMIVGDSQPETIKILDFGLSKILSNSEDAGQKLTCTGTIFGSVNYMSPEQCLGLNTDYRSDIYSIGCLLYECISGHPPFVCDNPITTLLKHRNEMPAPLFKTDSIDRQSKDLELIIFKCLQKQAEERFQTASDLGKALALLESGATQEMTFSAVQLNNKSEAGKSTSKHTALAIAAMIIPLVIASLIFLKPVVKNKPVSAAAHASSTASPASLPRPAHTGSLIWQLRSICQSIFSKTGDVNSLNLELKALLPQLKERRYLRLGYWGIGETEKLLKRYGKSVEAFQLALSNCRDGEGYWQAKILMDLAACTAIQPNPDLTEKYSKRWLELSSKDLGSKDDDYLAVFDGWNQDDALIYVYLSRAAIARHSYKSAEAYCKRALEVDKAENSFSPEMHTLKADIYVSEGKVEQAKKYIARLCDICESLLRKPQDSKKVISTVSIPGLKQALDQQQSDAKHPSASISSDCLNAPDNPSDAIDAMTSITKWYGQNGLSELGQARMKKCLALVETNHLEIRKWALAEAIKCLHDPAP